MTAPTDRRVCVVTGSSSGIGAATVHLFARNGWNVVVNGSRDLTPAEAVADACRALGAEALVVRADIASDADCRRLAAEVEARFGRADVLVNNAGTTKFVPVHDLDGLDAADFERIFAVNVTGTFQVTRAFVPLLKGQPGAAVVNVSSIASLMGTGSSLAYTASKGAINALTFGLARALGPAIRVNVVAPGMVDTPWLHRGFGEAGFVTRADAYRQRAALGDVVQPEDVAQAIWWLGVGAVKTTGEVLLVDGGAKLGRA